MGYEGKGVFKVNSLKASFCFLFPAEGIKNSAKGKGVFLVIVSEASLSLFFIKRRFCFL